VVVVIDVALSLLGADGPGPVPEAGAGAAVVVDVEEGDASALVGAEAACATSEGTTPTGATRPIVRPVAVSSRRCGVMVL
jgi:hypothetical protein